MRLKPDCHDVIMSQYARPTKDFEEPLSSVEFLAKRYTVLPKTL